MNVDSIQVSEYASRRGGGLLTVVNNFNRLQIPEPPLVMPSMAVSLVIHGSSAEADTSHAGEIHFINEDRESLTEEPARFEFSFPPEEEMWPGVPARHVHIWNLFQVQFDTPGPYAFEVYIDDTYHAAASFYIQIGS